MKGPEKGLLERSRAAWVTLAKPPKMENVGSFEFTRGRVSGSGCEMGVGAGAISVVGVCVGVDSCSSDRVLESLSVLSFTSITLGSSVDLF